MEAKVKENPVHWMFVLVRALGDPVDRQQTGLLYLFGRVGFESDEILNRRVVAFDEALDANVRVRRLQAKSIPPGCNLGGWTIVVRKMLE